MRQLGVEGLLEVPSLQHHCVITAQSLHDRCTTTKAIERKSDSRPLAMEFQRTVSGADDAMIVDSDGE